MWYAGGGTKQAFLLPARVLPERKGGGGGGKVGPATLLRKKKKGRHRSFRLATEKEKITNRPEKKDGRSGHHLLSAIQSETRMVRKIGTRQEKKKKENGAAFVQNTEESDREGRSEREKGEKENGYQSGGGNRRSAPGDAGRALRR